MQRAWVSRYALIQLSTRLIEQASHIEGASHHEDAIRAVVRRAPRGYTPLPMKIRLRFLVALVLAAFSSVALAQGFGSVSSGKRLPDEQAPAAAAASNPFMTTPAAAGETPNPFMTTPAAAGETANPFMTTPAAAGETSNPFMTTPAAAGGTPNPFMTTPAAAGETSNPFMNTPAAAGETSNPFMGTQGAGGEAAAASGSAATIPFGSTYSAAIAASPRALESADRILVKKSARRLYLLRSNRVLAEYPIRLGLNPYGPKLREGDFRTPEGVYELSRRNQHSDFFLSLEVSYPNAADRDRARQNGVKPGGLIMIHGQPNTPRKSPDYYASNDWTDGCIAVSNSDMVDIWLRTSMGTTIEILP
jgi:hypothetical protein